MKKILFISFPVYGHVNPQMNFCKELAQKDVHLIYYTNEKYFSKFADTDEIELRKYPDSFVNYYDKLAEDQTLAPGFMSLLYVFYTLTENVIPFIMEEVKKEKPDLIICDSLAIWGKVAARYYKVPMAFFFCGLMGDSTAISKSPSFKMSLVKSIIFDFPYVIKLNNCIKRIQKQYGKHVTDSMQNIMSPQGLFSIVMTSREFHPGGDEYPPNIKFIGPAHREDHEIPETKDTILVSIGTIAISDTFWDICIEAAKGLGYKVVISFGGNTANHVSEQSLSDQVEVYDNLSLDDYRNVLKRSVLFISHGGFNSISDSILYRTPLLICPITAEQNSNGKMIEEYGCGKLYPEKKVQAPRLREEIIKLIGNKEMDENLEKYRQSFFNALGYKKVVEELNKEFNLYEKKDDHSVPA
ncbi:glycosyltransferase [Dehalobacterium formicoaceticum]|uniref:Glycosyl transferase n=1 Tax=Dehalobacterium formicoaceticum TaxID=51515 RepID=A0ABT1XZY0_9FIRM|nr:glycosyltransferase [Dehalobacterium formicoaceticum]MCR6544172.1 glycosyl transferase [Dehalobacterium formicoaceticum]